jgi:hypothetical protein
MSSPDLIELLVHSEEPSIRWKTRVHVLGDDPESRALRKLRMEIRASPRVRKLLAGRDAAKHQPGTLGPYAKWQGSHWVLATLADLGYPAGDAALNAMRDGVLAAWLDESFYREFEATRKAEAYKQSRVVLARARAEARLNCSLTALRLNGTT